MILLGFGYTVSGFVPRRMARSLLAKTIQVTSISFSTASSTKDDSKSDVLEPLIVCGPSGVGKGTIINKYMEEMGGNQTFGFTVSHTTRSPREGEVDGLHYHFTSIGDIQKDIDDGKFIEYAEVHGNYYGTSWSSLRDVQKNGKRCLLDIDVQGVQNIKKMESDMLKPKYVFIAPPSMDSLKERLIGRGSESEDTLARRTANAQREIDYGMAEGNFDAIVVNGDLDTACQDFAKTIQELF